ncbi:MAG: hypothetical protein LLG00_02180 [Planctomycetaceae bacterium]|nr:hypothetical protein [Planctomycetaceae bacterium]
MRSEREFLVDVLARLNRLGINYMLTGSMASNYWGIPRTTHDLDFVLVMKPEQVNLLVSAFDTDFFIQPESVRSAFQPPFQFNVLDGQSALKADFWLLRADAFEQTAFGRRLQVNLFGISAWIASAEDIILHKLYWNKLNPSDRQLGDTAGVFAVQGSLLDLNYLRHWAAILHVQTELDALIEGRIKPKQT